MPIYVQDMPIYVKDMLIYVHDMPIYLQCGRYIKEKTLL